MKTTLFGFLLMLCCLTGYTQNEVLTPISVILNVETHPLYEKTIKVITRNNTAIYILNPIVLEMQLIIPKELAKPDKIWDLFENAFNNTRDNVLAPTNKLLRNANSLTTEETKNILSTIKGPHCFIKDTKASSYTSILRVQNHDGPEMFGIYGFRYNYGSYADSLPGKKTYAARLILEAENIPESLFGKELTLFYYVNTQPEEGTPYLIESNTFRFTKQNADTEMIIDRKDTFIDNLLYQNYPSPPNSLFADITDHYVSEYELFNPIQLKDSLRLKYGILNSETCHDTIWQGGDTVMSCIMMTDKFNITYFTSKKSRDIAKFVSAVYYPSRKSEYLFYGLYSNDGYTTIKKRIERERALIEDYELNWKVKKGYKSSHCIRIWGSAIRQQGIITLYYNFSKTKIKRIEVIIP